MTRCRHVPSARKEFIWKRLKTEINFGQKLRYINCLLCGRMFSILVASLGATANLCSKLSSIVCRQDAVLSLLCYNCCDKWVRCLNSNWKSSFNWSLRFSDSSQLCSVTSAKVQSDASIPRTRIIFYHGYGRAESILIFVRISSQRFLFLKGIHRRSGNRINWTNWEMFSCIQSLTHSGKHYCIWMIATNPLMRVLKSSSMHTWSVAIIIF